MIIDLTRKRRAAAERMRRWRAVNREKAATLNRQNCERRKEQRFLDRLERQLDDPNFLEKDLPAWPESVLESVQHTLLDEHRTTLARYESGWRLSYPFSIGALGVSANSPVLSRMECSAAECTIPIIGDDSKSALFLAGVILRDHTPPRVVVPADESEEKEAPAPARQGKARRPAKVA